MIMQGKDYVILSFILKCSPNVSKKNPQNTKALWSLQWTKDRFLTYSLKY